LSKSHAFQKSVLIGKQLRTPLYSGVRNWFSYTNRCVPARASPHAQRSRLRIAFPEETEAEAREAEAEAEEAEAQEDEEEEEYVSVGI